MTITFRDLQLTLFGTDQELRNQDLDQWEELTEGFIVNFFNTNNFGLSAPLLVDLDVTGRDFDNGADSNEITFDTTFTIRSSSQDVQLGALAYLWLGSAFSRAFYVNLLQTEGNNRLDETENVSRVTGTGLPPNLAAMVPVEVEVPNLSLSVLGNVNILNTDGFEIAMEEYIREYVTEINPAAFALTGLTIDIQVTAIDTSNELNYAQIMTFNTDDESLVPLLVDSLAKLPFCSDEDRATFVRSFLRNVPGFGGATGISDVEGVAFECPGTPAPSVSAAPSSVPEPTVSLEPTQLPDDTPVPTPSEDQSRLVQVTFRDLSLTLSGTNQELRDQELASWDSLTTNFIANFFAREDFGLTGALGVNLLVTDDDFDGGTDTTEITYDVTYTIRSSSEDLQLGELAYAWLSDAFTQAFYVNQLQSNGVDRLSRTTGVSQVSGTGLPGDNSPLVPLEVTVPNLAMTFLPAAAARGTPENFAFATQFYLDDYVTITNPAAFPIDRSTFSVSVDSSSVSGGVASYRQEMAFSAASTVLVPELIDSLAKSPFCKRADRAIYVQQFLRLVGGFANVNDVNVEGVEFECPGIVTSAPSGSPTAEPTAIDTTDAPSSSASPTDSQAPSVTPTMAPTPTEDQSRLVSITFTSLSVVLETEGGNLNEEEQAEFASITENFISGVFSRSSFGIAGTPVVEVTVTDVDRDNGEDETTITYDATYTIRSSSQDLGIAELAFVWLEDQFDRDFYVSTLQRSSFAGISQTTGVRGVFGTGIPTGPQIPVSVNIPNLEMQLFGSQIGTLENFEFATQFYVDEYITSELTQVRNPVVTITPRGSRQASAAEDFDFVIFYEQTTSFSTGPNQLVPDLVDRLAKLPFCAETDRRDFLETRLNLVGFEVQDVNVDGVAFDCPVIDER